MLPKLFCLLLAVHTCGSGLIPIVAGAAQIPPVDPPLTEILVDGNPLPETSFGGFQVPASHKAVSFRLGKSPEGHADGPVRLRFKLDGIDNEWREMPSEMCLTVRFLDAAGDQVGQKFFPVSGRSAGWSGSIENFHFTPRKETVTVPPRGVLLTVSISSSGPPTAVGAYVVQGLKVQHAAPRETEVLLDTDSDADGSRAIPRGWIRNGTRSSMARMVNGNSGSAFGIVDVDPTTHAEWNLSRAAAPMVQPGESLTVQWREMYSIGTGNRFDVNFGRLNAGTYRFWIEEEDAVGKPLGSPGKIDFTVLGPVWKTGWFWSTSIAAIGVLIWLGCRAVIRARIRQHLAKAEQERLVERERLRIAQDLHDDLGARLTHISLVSGLAERDPQSASSRESFRRISGMARDLVSALYQTVWTVNPENDHLEALVNYLGQLTQSLCEAAGIRCRLHSGAVPAGRRVTSEIRHGITLAVKEAVHNAIKHAAATEIAARMEFNDPRLTIVIADNGRGFDPAVVARGCGLANMRRRMEVIGGTFSIEGAAKAGTCIRFDVPISAESKNPSHTPSAARP